MELLLEKLMSNYKIMEEDKRKDSDVSAPDYTISKVKGVSNAFNIFYKGASATFSYHPDEDIAHFDMLEVPEGLRRKGIGTELGRIVVAELRKRYPGKTIYGHPSSEAGLRIMKKIGFKRDVLGDWVITK